MKILFALGVSAFMLALPCVLFAGFTETIPQETFLLDTSFFQSSLNNRWNDDGELVPLIDPMVRYEAGAGKQGILKPKVQADLGVLALQLHYGITDSLLVGIGVPIVMYAHVDPKFEWEEGDYQWNLGRTYSEKDFWDWAGSMGQPKPGKWEGSNGVLADIILASRWRFTDKSEWFRDRGLAMSFMFMGALPTGTQAESEKVVSAGTTTWELHTNGDLCFHLGLDKFFRKSLNNRLVLGLDAFYEIMLPHEYTAPQGEENPLMLNIRPYTGKYYTIDGGDFSGFSTQIDVVPIKGKARQTWLTKGNPELAAKFPPILTLTARYTFTHLQQSDWESDSDVWDWEQEEMWKPGYKNILFGQASLALFRFGIPVMPYASYRNITWLPGKNTRAPNVLGLGIKAILKFW